MGRRVRPPTLTRPTGVTMRNLRRCRQLWAVRTGLLPPPAWSGMELAQVVLLPRRAVIRLGVRDCDKETSTG
jgi:hypothetical protein